MAGSRRPFDWRYSTLHKTGKRIPISRNKISNEAEKEGDNMDESGTIDNNGNTKHLIQVEEVCEEAISDFFEENVLADAYSFEEIDSNVVEIKNLRTEYKRLHRQLKSAIEDYETGMKPKYDEICQKITDYIKDAKAEKKTRADDLYVQDTKDRNSAKDAQIAEDQRLQKEKVEQEDRICKIKIKEITEKIDYIKSMCSSVDTLEDDEVLELKNNLSNIDQELRDLRDMRDKFENLIGDFVNKETVMSTLAADYKKTNDAAVKYKNELKVEIKKRDLEDYKLKATSKVNILIPKFSGTDHKIDIYTFQTKFNEEHARLPKSKCLYQLKEKFLGGPAKEMVKLIENIDEIWKVLKDAYGDPRVLLNCELENVRKLGSLSKIRDHQELSLALSKLANAMENLKKTAKTHSIQHELYNSHTEGLIYEIMGDQRVDRFLEKFDSKAGSSSENDWDLMIEFIRNEARRKSRMALKLNTVSNKSHKSDKDKSNLTSKANYSDSTNLEEAPNCYQIESKSGCKVCGESSCENKDEKEFEYVKCKKFRDMKPSERLSKLKKDKKCFQCLKPRHPYKKECRDKEFACPNEDHKKFTNSFHVIACEEHHEADANKKLLEEYKLKIFKKKANIPQNFVTTTPTAYKVEVQTPKVPVAEEDDVEEREHAVYMLQRIRVEEELCNLFYDGGCGDMVCSHEAATRLKKVHGDRAVEVIPGPTKLIGVSDTVIESEHGLWMLKLPMANGLNAVVSGLCLNKVTHTIPEYEFDAAVKDIKKYCRQNNIDINRMPQFPTRAGGDTAVMLGMQYKKYFPTDLVELPNGLTFCESKFVGVDGTRGVICGPHWSFTAALKRGEVQYVVNAYNTFFKGTNLVESISLLGFKEENDPLRNKYIGDQSYYGRTTKCIEAHEAAERAGTLCDYRCNECRNCPNCKKGESIEKISLTTELHQALIDKSVTVDIEKGVSVARLPIIEENPEEILVPNGEECKKIFLSVAKQIRKDPQCKDKVVEFEQKLQRMGFVEYVKNLTPEQQKCLAESIIKNFIPWLIARNKNSVTTDTRMVFNGSKEFNGKRCVNSLLAKGANSMNSLLEIVLRFCIHIVAFHTDVQKMYNSVLLDSEYWCYQRYWWQDELNPENPVEEKIIKTLIYGMRPSGNQAERALRLTASLMADEFPKAATIIKRDTYVDDLLSGDQSMNEAKDLAEDVKIVLLRGGFKLKGVTYAGEDPPKHLSEDGKTVKTVGWKWWSKDDEVQLCVGDLAFEKVKKWNDDIAEKVIPKKFTRAQCHSKVAQIFDLTGKVAPLVGGMKLDLRKLNNIPWKDTIPDELRQVWADNFEMIKEIGELRFQRCVIPENAVNLDIETLDFGDSSDSLICTAIYVRVKRVTGDYSCQLMFARTKLLPEGTSVPRGELAAAELCATTGFVVRRALGKYSKGYCKFTDSQAALFWLNSRDKPLNQWVRGKVIEINRLSDRRRWSYIQSSDNVADIGTRKGAQVKDVDRDSVWMNGMDWMTKEEKDFPTMTVDEINFKSVKDIVNSEMHKYGKILEGMKMVMSVVDASVYTNCVQYKVVPEAVTERYQFCNYLIDPNKFRLRKVIRIVALTMRFIKNTRNAVRRRKNLDVKAIAQESVKKTKVPLGLNDHEDSDVFILEDIEVIAALTYFYKKSTNELKRFRKKRDYERISEEVDGILYYKGRILLEQNVTGVKDMCDVMIDLSCRTFWVPLVDRYSPFAYSIINEVHWHSKEAKHTGVEKTIRYTLHYAHIIEARELIKSIKKSCVKCRILAKKQLEVVMGPVSPYNLNVAPAFYFTQVDLMGPLDSYYGANKRLAMKVWVIVFCCCTTGAVDLKVMESYTSSSFILGFKRFGSRAGFPKMLLPDQGSQLVKACGDVKLKFKDIKGQLNTEYGVQFEPCPVGAHYMHGRVERKIRHIRESLSRSFVGQKLSTIGWETVCAEIANCINDLPIGLKTMNADLENLDLLTPNRLLLGRNNDRSPVEPVEVPNSYNKIIDANNDVYRIWFKCWLIEYVPKLMQQQKWFKSSERKLVVGDIVLFKSKEKEIETTYKYGRVKELLPSRDGIPRTVIVEYQNSGEKVKRTTKRGARELILIQHINEVGVMYELNEAARSGES